ncbi:MAG TPA: GvpL/GvpF family gas vesicle protein [Rhodopila sp.]|nr:GvpL/GvpF family gas vesicle protein [Rhodopila sp.]
MSRPIYIYGLVRGGDVTQPALGTGLGDAPIRLLPASDLAVLVSDLPPGTVARSRRNMIAHTRVLERATARVDVLPLRFGTVAPHANALTQCISTNIDKLRAALDDVAGRVELGLKASWRDGVIFNEIVRSEPDLGLLRDRLRSRPAQETYYDRLELGRRVEAALVARRTFETKIILGELSSLAEREADLPIVSEDMIFNRAFLLRRKDEPLFDERVQTIGNRHGARIDFLYVGPVPPYSFVTVQVAGLTEAA